MLFTQAGQSDGEINIDTPCVQYFRCESAKNGKERFSTLLRYTEIVSKNYLR